VTDAGTKTPLGIRISRLVWVPLRLKTFHLRHRWRKAVQRAPETQARLLHQILEDLSETDFGRRHGLQRVRTIEDLRKALPIAGYERAAPFIERMKQGETGVLLPRGTRLHMFAMSSGTTGTPKYIPITDAVLAAYRRGWHVWGVQALDDNFEAFGAKLLQITSRMDEEITPAGIPAGAMSGFTAFAQPRLIQKAYVTPPEVSSAADTATKYYLACRLGLQVRRVMPMTANPSTLLGLAKTMDARREELLRDLADGTMKPDLAIDPASRRRIESRLKAMPDRARELEVHIRQTGRLYPKDVWQLPLIATWKGGTLGLYMREMPLYWGDAPVRDIGLIASEGRFSVPMQTEGSAGVLEVTGIFFEFVPEEEIGNPNPTVLLPHEVEVGRHYYIIPTTPNGLVRYHIGDVVRVTGWMGPAPIIEFLNKGEHVSSLTGEKITEFQVTSAVQDSLERLQLPVRNYCLCPTWTDVPYYSLLVEENEAPAARAPELAGTVDQALRRQNIEYEAKRSSGRLGPVCVKTIPEDAWQDYDSQMVAARGGRIEQYKHKFLVNTVDFEQRFTIRASFVPPR
jgi:hypothetical protein